MSLTAVTNNIFDDLTRSDYSSLSSSLQNQAPAEADNSDFVSIITHAKPAQISISDSNASGSDDIEITAARAASSSPQCYSYELVFQQNAQSSTTTAAAKLEQTFDSDISSFASSSAATSTTLEKFCAFVELPTNGSLLLATQNGILGAINPQKSICKWIVVTKQINYDLPTHDGLYNHHEKVLVDVCTHNDTNEVILLTKYDSTRLNKYCYSIETYTFNATKYTLSLTSILEVPQLLFSQTGVKIITNTAYDYEFTRIYYDSSDNCFVLLDKKHHKIYWLLKQNCQIRRCVKSNDGESMEAPSGLALVKSPPSSRIMYVCNRKGLLICHADRQPVTHDTLKPCDITYCPLEKAVYFIDTHCLYRFKVSDTNENEQRYKKIFSNRNPSERKLFKRVLACRDHLFIMTNDANSVFVVERSTLKF